MHMGSTVTTTTDGVVTTVTMDDGKVNALSLATFEALGEAFDRAEAAGTAVVLTGRDEVFSAGFDLRVLQAMEPEAPRMLRAGFELARRLLSFPRPVVVACNG